jgi:SAM-dependent methyltransferase
VRADARNALLQAGELAARAAGGRLEAGWSHADPQILETQGVMSAAAVEPLARFVFPSLEGLPERLAAPGAAFLDVGAGVAEVGLELCRRFEHLRVVGLEPAAAPRELALAKIAAAGLADRLEMRDQRVEELDDEAAFDVAWLPLPFLPAAVAEPAICAVHRALRPGGWLLAATLGSPAGGDLGDALAAFRSVLWGGGPLAPGAVEELLVAAGFTDVAAGPRSGARMTPLRARRQ